MVTDDRRRSWSLILCYWQKLGRVIGLCRISEAASGGTGTVKDRFKGIGEAGVALIEDRGVPGRNLEAAVSCADGPSAGPPPCR